MKRIKSLSGGSLNFPAELERSAERPYKNYITPLVHTYKNYIALPTNYVIVMCGEDVLPHILDISLIVFVVVCHCCRILKILHLEYQTYISVLLSFKITVSTQQNLEL